MYTDGRIIFNLEELHIPSSHDEIVTVIQEAYKNKKNVRVLAAGHSWSEVAQTQDIYAQPACTTTLDWQTLTKRTYW